jgi:hypothetical protein
MTNFKKLPVSGANVRRNNDGEARSIFIPAIDHGCACKTTIVAKLGARYLHLAHEAILEYEQMSGAWVAVRDVPDADELYASRDTVMFLLEKMQVTPTHTLVESTMVPAQGEEFSEKSTPRQFVIVRTVSTNPLILKVDRKMQVGNDVKEAYTFRSGQWFRANGELVHGVVQLSAIEKRGVVGAAKG